MSFTPDQLSKLEKAVNAGDRIGYYTLLAKYGDVYAGLALGVVNSDTVAGRTANTFFLSQASAEGKNIGNLELATIGLQLMEADFKLRQKSSTGILTGQQISDYHKEVFERHGVSANAWTPFYPMSLLTTAEAREAYWTNLLTSSFQTLALVRPLGGSWADTSWGTQLVSAGAASLNGISTEYGPYTVSWGGNTSVIGGDWRNDRLSGDEKNNVIMGFYGFDRLVGGDGEDILYGADGNDHLYGDIVEFLPTGFGSIKECSLINDNKRDILYGGAGYDTYYVGGMPGFYAILDYDNVIEKDKNEIIKELDVIMDGDDSGRVFVNYSKNFRAVFRSGDNGEYYGEYSGAYSLEHGKVRASKTDDGYVIWHEGDIKGKNYYFFIIDSINLSGAGRIPGGVAAGLFPSEEAEGSYGSFLGIQITGLMNQVRGDENGNILNGSALDDYINGGAGDDEIRGAAGEDVIDAGAGNDVVYGDAGYNTIQGDDGDDRIYNGDDGGTLSGGAGDDEIRSGAGDDIIDGDAGNDRLYGGAGEDTIRGGAGDDLIFAEAGYNTVLGGEGDDIIYNGDDGGDLSGDAGNDEIHGGAGKDLIKGGAGADVIYGGAGDDVLIGGLGVDLVDGGDGNDVIYGGSTYDIVLGEEGGDHLIGGAGDDTFYVYGIDSSIDGGAGNDIIVFQGYENYTVDLRVSGLQNVYGARNIEIISIENVYGSDRHDVFYGDDADNLFDGGYGNDRLYGGGGDDTLIGNGGNDLLDGGDGFDWADYSVLYSDSERGVFVDLRRTDAQDTLNAGLDTLLNIEGVRGSSYYDTLIAGDGGATLDGGAGNDWLYSGAGDDYLNGGAGFNGVSYALAGSGVTVDLRLTGAQNTRGGGADTLVNVRMVEGSNYDDQLYGDASGEILIGGAGRDQLNGLGGTDTYVGGAGADFFCFTTAPGADVAGIQDFSLAEGDVIVLGTSAFAGLVNAGGVLGAASFGVGSAATTASQRIFYNSETGGLFYDADGSGAGAAVQFAMITPNLNLTSQSFWLV